MLSYECLNLLYLNKYTKNRRKYYVDDRQRKQDEEAYQVPKVAFLRSLNMKFIISQAKAEDLERLAELTARTNQLNTTGVIFSQEELDNLKKSNKHKLFVCEMIY